MYDGTIITRVRNFIQTGIWRMAVGAAIIACYGYTLKDMAWDVLIRTLQAWQWFDIGKLAVLNLLILGTMCWRWHRILARMGFTIMFYRLMLYRIGSNAISTLTPGPQFGGEPFQVYWLRRHHRIPMPEALASVAADRLLETMVNIAFILISGIYLAWQGMYFKIWPGPVLISLCLALMALCALTTAYVGNKRPLSRMRRFFTYRRIKVDALKQITASIDCCEEKLGATLRQPVFVLCLYGAAAVSLAILMVGEFWLIYSVMGVALTPAQLIVVVAMARLALWAPLPGALGALEAGQTAALTILGLDPVIGMAACMVMRIRDLLLVGVGAGLTMTWLAKAPCSPYGSRAFSARIRKIKWNS